LHDEKDSKITESPIYCQYEIRIHQSVGRAAGSLHGQAARQGQGAFHAPQTTPESHSGYELSSSRMIDEPVLTGYQ
jgi:hypothetical protein